MTICEMRVHTKTIANNIVGNRGCRRCDDNDDDDDDDVTVCNWV